MRNRLVPLFAFAALMSACGDDNPVRPTAAPSVHAVSGIVTEPVGVAVMGASLRVTDSEKSQMITPGDADYRASVREGPVTIEVTKQGYHPKTVSVEVHGSVRQDIEIEPLTPAAAFAGSYWMTLSADPPSCGTLPAALRTRRYAVDVEQAGAALTLQMSDSRLTGERVPGRLDGNALSFQLWSPDWYYGMGAPTVEETLDDTRRLVIVGGVRGEVSPSGAAGQLTGTWTLLENVTVTGACEGVHGVRFDRR